MESPCMRSGKFIHSSIRNLNSTFLYSSLWSVLLKSLGRVWPLLIFLETWIPFVPALRFVLQQSLIEGSPYYMSHTIKMVAELKPQTLISKWRAISPYFCGRCVASLRSRNMKSTMVTSGETLPSAIFDPASSLWTRAALSVAHMVLLMCASYSETGVKG